MKQKVFTLLTLALFFCSGAWADDVLLKSMDFTNTTNFPAVTYYSSSADVTATVNGVYFWAKKSKNIKVNNTTDGVDFDGQNIGSNGQHGIAIPVTGVNGSITVKVTHNYNTTSAAFKVGIAHATDNDPSKTQTWDLSITNSGTKNKDDFQITKTGLSGTDYIVWVGENGSSYKVLKQVDIYTTASSGKSNPSLSVSPTTVTLAKNGTQQLTPSQSGDGAISYESSNENVATVTSGGLVTAVGYGSATITVTSAETEDYDAGTTTVGVTVKETDPTILQYAQFDNGLTCSPDGFVTISGSINYNSNYPGTYGGNTYSKGLKMQGDTQINFTTTSISCDLVIVQSTNTNVNNFKIDDVAFATDYDTKYYYDIPANKVRVHVYKGLTAGNHTIIRATSSELGILYVGVTEAPAPSLSVSPSTASAFSYVEGNGPSAAQTFTVTGENLTADDITVSLNAGSTYYEISDDGSTYGTSNLTVASGDAVYVRLKAGISLGADYAGTLRFANDGADNVDIALSGSVTKQTYSVTYNLNGASGDAPTETAKEEDEVFALAAAPTRDCYTFDGWLCNVDGVTYAAGDDYTMTAAPTTFTAQWSKVYASGSYTFENNATVGTSPSKTVTTSKVTYAAFHVDNLYFSGMDIQYEAGVYGGEGDDFKGWKIKTKDATIKFFVASDKSVIIGVGNLSSGAKISYTNTAGEEQNDIVLTAKTNNTYNVKGGTMVTIKTDDANTVTLKKIYIMDAVSTISATVGKNGYTTFASPYALDLTDANRPDGLKAYKATRDGANISFAALNQTVAPGTGLLLLGETKDGSYDIKVVASGDAIYGNALIGVTSITPKQSIENDTYYFVMKKAANAESALEFLPLSTSAVNIPAGKAYIEVPNSAFDGPAQELSFTFEDESGDVTGITSVAKPQTTNNASFYDLQGRRVAQPTKGLYIMNGKKVIVK